MGFFVYLLSLFLYFTFFGLQTVCGNSELRVLMDMKAVLDPENRILSSWTSDGNPCSGSFEGVACNEHGKVANISLQGKRLSGKVPSAVAGLKWLSGLYLHYNSLSGEIPKEISNLTQLSDLYLNVNSLSGSIPSEIENMASLEVLQLCCNQLTGSIPTQLGSLKKLSFLALQSNRLMGAIPASLGNLRTLVRLDLSYNRLFGAIPVRLADVPYLKVLDVRNNTLSGSVPPALKRLKGGFQYGNNSGLCGVGFSSLEVCTASTNMNPNKPESFGPGTNGGITKDIPESANIRPHCNNTHCSNRSKSPQIGVVFGVIAVIVTLKSVAGLLVFSWYRRRKQKIASALETTDSRLSIDQAKEVYRKSASPLSNLEYSNGWDPLADGRNGNWFSQEGMQSFRFNLDEVVSATQYFSEVNLLGKSNFSAIYKGILRDGSVVAIKSINKSSCKLEESEFLKGLNILTSLRHENLVGLRGFCCSSGRGECFLIYDFVPNGNLLQYLDVKDGNGQVLEWSIRVSIINGIAKGIEYLHSHKVNKPALVHQNISAEKVLIDQQFNPLLSDSGLHNLLADDIVFSKLKACAAMGYLAPEYTTTGRFTEKSDMYAFGVIVFQILSGKRKITQSMQLGAESCRFEDFIDPNLEGNFSESEAAKLARIALICTHDSPNQRLTMETVIQELGKCSSSTHDSPNHRLTMKIVIQELGKCSSSS
ncbi:hypothetical protein HHK36_001011 [Tetracentron sinense]|uniref:Protein kinase domain-containing protein n=1 Tax=Tetracentron sinense TaxID=13715 RepID=A0A834ZV67_TETSI|nr:hypothetical protein HHK36_001011 [Tetracentron sinense]